MSRPRRRASVRSRPILAGLSAVGLPVGVLVLGLGLNAWRLDSQQVQPPRLDTPALDGDRAVLNLAAAIRFRTLGDTSNRAAEPDPFRAFHAFLATAYPRVHESMRVETVDDLSLLFTWNGRDPTLTPVVLMAHQDVVPAGPAGDLQWTHPPFDGVVADGFVWGRGALDDKAAIIATLEACERLLTEGFVPARTVHLAFGHDEETGGRGAARIGRTLTERGVHEYALVLDEGGAIFPAGTLPGLDLPVALIGIAEKSVVNLRLTARRPGGHASAPPSETAIGVLGGAIARLEAHPFPAGLGEVTATMLRHAAPEMAWSYRLVFANPWPFEPVVTRILAAEPRSAALVRTTLAPTVIQAGTAANVLPGHAEATLNLRLLPGVSPGAAVARVRSTIDDDRISVEIVAGSATEPGPVSDPQSKAFTLLAGVVRGVGSGPPPVVTPYLTIAAVDARWYASRSKHVFRFRGTRWEADATERLHGVDERVAVPAFLDSVAFLYHLLRQTDRL